MVNNLSDKISNVILLRGIAALGVCLVHIQLLTGVQSLPFLNEIINQGQLGVQIFFIISGFILPLSLHKNDFKPKNFFRFILKRSLRIDPPFWISIVLTLIITKIPFFEDYLNVFYNMFYLVPFINDSTWYSDIYWTLGIEFQYYILLGICYPIFEKISSKYTLLILTILFYISILNPAGNSRNFIVDSIGFFIIGYICYLTYSKKIRYDVGLSIALSLGLSYGLIIAYRYGIISLFTILFILFVKPISSRPIKFIGEISYSLYITHIITIIVFLPIFPIKQVPPELSILFFLALCILFGWVFNKIIEGPSMKLSKKVNYS